jgi:hypothetical protein
MLLPTFGLTVVALLAAQGAPDFSAQLAGELAFLRGQVLFLQTQVQQRDEAMANMKTEMHSISEAVGGLRDRVASPLAGPFLEGPPPSSDSVGVAKVAVFAPKVEVDASQRHDVVLLKVRRIEAGAIRAVGEVELGTDVNSVDLPLDQNGALYVVDWSTSEGYNYSLILRDGASHQSAATVMVKQLQNEGHFILVGYRID